ncbi:MAG: SDR family oxidoreductase [Pseudomonadota bacterium]
MNLAMQNQHALITGGGSGIGYACAAAMLADGAAVTLVGRDRERLEAAVESLGAGANLVAADVADEEAIAAAVATANAAAPLTIAIANAGTGTAGPLLNTERAEWDRVMGINLNGTFHTFKHAGRAIAANGGGALCAISSIAGLRTHRLMSTYCASKAAIDMLVRNAADELGASGVRVNSVCPGLVATELSAGLQNSEAMTADYLSCMPVARIGQPADVAAAVRFLCGPEASWITGAVLPVDGGHHLRRGPNLEIMTGA